MIVALLLAAAIAAGRAEDGCDSSAPARATCDAGLATEAAAKRVASAYRAALAVAKRADRNPKWTQPGFQSAVTYAALLRQSQRAWEAFADKQCDFEELEERYGTQEGVIYARCYGKLARERILWLRGVARTYR